MKPTKQQLQMITCCQQFLDQLASSNDINSPSHNTDAAEAFHNCDGYFEAEEGSPQGACFALAETALSDLWCAIADMGKTLQK